MTVQKINVHPLTTERWMDLVALFGEHGAQGGCWCMWWRSRPKVYEKNAGERNEYAFKELVDSKQPVGLLAYVNAQVVGWCSVAPREQLVRVRTSTTWRPFDELPVWAISCFFVDKHYRDRQIANQLLLNAVKYAHKNGAIAVEAYPKDLSGATKLEKGRSVYFGTMKMFKDAGFEEVMRRHPSFPIMRLWL